MNAQYVLDEQGRVVGFEGVTRDISERRLAEEALRKTEEKFRTAFMTIHDAFYIATLEEGLISEVNNRFEDVFGYARDEAMGKTSAELGLWVDYAARSRMVEELRTKGFSHGFETVGRRKDGETFPCLISTTVFPMKATDYIAGLVQDTTDLRQAEGERRELERQLGQSQRLEAVGQLAGGIAHDFNNLLTPIIGASELLLAGWGTEEAERTDVEDIRSAADVPPP
jgi:two-component system cell cycle sensor histidine kinase/response regulator CckA